MAHLFFWKNVAYVKFYLFIWPRGTLENSFKRKAQFIFLCSSHYSSINHFWSSVNVCFMKIWKSTVTKKVIVCFNNLGEEKF